MQYILTQEEYQSLLKMGNDRIVANTKDLQELCTLVANHVPFDWGWGDRTPKPWGCILTTDMEYCNQCPARKLCPNPAKSWSQ